MKSKPSKFSWMKTLCFNAVAQTPNNWRIKTCWELNEVLLFIFETEVLAFQQNLFFSSLRQKLYIARDISVSTSSFDVGYLFGPSSIVWVE